METYWLHGEYQNIVYRPEEGSIIVDNDPLLVNGYPPAAAAAANAVVNSGDVVPLAPLAPHIPLTITANINNAATNINSLNNNSLPPPAPPSPLAITDGHQQATPNNNTNGNNNNNNNNSTSAKQTTPNSGQNLIRAS